MKQLSILVMCIFILSAGAEPAWSGILDIFRVDWGSVDIHTEDVEVEVDFGYEDRRKINQYYRTARYHKRAGKHKLKHKWKHGRLPPGLAKKKQLPYGLAKKIYSGKPLPRDMHREELPYELEVRLKRLPKDFVRVRVGGSVVILDQHTDIVIDVIRDLE